MDSSYKYFYEFSWRRPLEDYKNVNPLFTTHKTTHGPCTVDPPTSLKKDHFIRQIGFQIVHK